MSDWVERRWELPGGDEVVVRVRIGLDGFTDGKVSEIVLPEVISGDALRDLVEILDGASDLIDNRFQFHKVLGY